MKNLILLFALSFLVISCGNKKNLSEEEYVPIDDDWDEVEVDPTLADDEFEELGAISTVTPTRDTIKIISSQRHIKEECDCVHFANNILYGNFQSLDIITSKELFEEYREEIETDFWFGDVVAYCVNAFNSNGYMGKNPKLDNINIESNPGKNINLLIAALPDCAATQIWHELRNQFKNKFDEVSKKYE